jgi:hypothetical protein
MKRFTHHQLGQAVVALALLVTLACTEVIAATSAYWRHEEGPLGSIVPDGPATVLDSTGNGNNMETFSSAFAPFTAATYVSEVSPLALRSGLDNTLALDFGPEPVEGVEDGADPLNGNARNDDNYSAGAPINMQLFSAITVELAFNMHDVTGFQALVGKDGKPLGDAPGEDDSPVQPFVVKVRGDSEGGIPNQLQVEWIDGDGTLFGDIHSLLSGETIVPNQWYHVAFTLSAAGAELWMAEESGDYILVDAETGEDYVGPSGEVIVADNTAWSIGRGMFGNGVTDWSNAIIDEVRVSDTALTPNEFLFDTVPGGQAGDFDGDGDVDGRDFLFWQRDTSVGNLADWQNSYGADGLVAFAAVPEPATWTLLFGLIGVGASLRSGRIG